MCIDSIITIDYIQLREKGVCGLQTGLDTLEMYVFRKPKFQEFIKPKIDENDWEFRVLLTRVRVHANMGSALLIRSQIDFKLSFPYMLTLWNYVNSSSLMIYFMPTFNEFIIFFHARGSICIEILCEF